MSPIALVSCLVALRSVACVIPVVEDLSLDFHKQIFTHFQDLKILKFFTEGDYGGTILQNLKASFVTLSYSLDSKALQVINDMGTYGNDPCVTCGYLVVTDRLPSLKYLSTINTNGRWLFVAREKDTTRLENFLLVAWLEFHMLNLAILRDNGDLLYYSPFEKGGAQFSPVSQMTYNQRLRDHQGGRVNISFTDVPHKSFYGKPYFGPRNPLERRDYVRGALIDYIVTGVGGVPFEISHLYPHMETGIQLKNGTMTGLFKMLDMGQLELMGNSRPLLNLGRTNIAYLWNSPDRMRIVVPASVSQPTTIRQAFEVLNSPAQWCSMFLLIAMAAIWFLAGHSSLGGMLLNFVAVLQNVSIKHTSRRPTNRLVFAMLLFYAFIMNNTYQGSIVSRLSMTASVSNIETIEQLLATNLSMVAVVLSADLLKPSDSAARNSTEYRMYERTIMARTFGGVDDLIAGKQLAVLLREGFAETLKASQYDCRSGFARFHIIRESPFPFLDSFPVRRNSPFLASYKRLIQQAIEAGIQQYGLQRAHYARHLELMERHKTSCQFSVQTGVQPMALVNLGPIFSAWMKGLVVSMVAFVVELAWYRYQRARSSYMRSFVRISVP